MNQTSPLQETSPVQGFTKKVVIALAALLLVLCAAFSFTGCKPPEGQLAANAAVTEVAAIEKQRWEVLKGLPAVAQVDKLEEIGISTDEFYSMWLSDFKWEMGDMDMDLEEENAYIEATITCRFLAPLLDQWSTQYMAWLTDNATAIKAGQTEDPCEYGRLLFQGIFENNPPTEHACVVHVQKIEDTWTVIDNPENGIFKDALIGTADNIAGYYDAPIDQLKKLGVTLPPASNPAEGDQAE